MKQKLLFLFMLLASMDLFAQPVANQPPDMYQCQSEVFDLTLQTGIILGNQDPTQYTVTYYLTEQNAHDQVNPIQNPQFFVGQQSQFIIGRVDDELSSAYALTGFMIGWGSIFVPQMEDVTACGSYELPNIEIGQYYSQPNGQGVQIPVGSVITVTQTVYVFAQDGACTGESDFVVTISDTPFFQGIEDVTSCGPYNLPQLPIGNYFTGSGGTGTQIFPGTMITETQTIYAYVSNGACTGEESFVVTIVNAPPLEPFENVYSCTPYTLPSMSGDYSLQYFMDGLPIAGFPTVSQTSEFTVVATFLECSVEAQFAVIIGLPGVGQPETLTECNTGSGTAVFNVALAMDWLLANMETSSATAHLSLADAQADVNPIANAGSYISGTDTLYIRVESDSGDCYTIRELQLIVEECTDFVITGTIYLDTDGNGCTDADQPAANIMVGAFNGNNIQWAYTNSEGEYMFTNVQEGTTILELNGVPSGYSNPGSQSVTFPGSGNVQVANFCLEVAPPVNDVSVYIYPQGTARPGLPAMYALIVFNEGNQAASGTATVAFDMDSLSFISALPVPTGQTGNVLSFSFSNLAPGETTYIFLNFMVGIPPVVELGDILEFNATVTMAGDSNLENNTWTFLQTVVNSQDPNDITVVEGPFITEAQADGYLNYIVRFQNIGTADAINVRIENELDTYLNWNTFVPVASSHSYMANRVGGNVEFRFDNINLPGASVNEPASHGWIAYKVMPVASLMEGQVISNSADIYFDFNAPITTNTVTTQIQSLNVEIPEVDGIRMYPNPASGMVTIESMEVPDSIQIFDIQGKMVMSVSNNLSGVQSLDVSGLESGLYFVRVNSLHKMWTKKLLKL